MSVSAIESRVRYRVVIGRAGQIGGWGLMGGLTCRSMSFACACRMQEFSIVMI